MRYLATLGTCLIATTCFGLTATAQNFGNNNNESTRDAVTFVLELDDAMIEALKRGEPLKSSIPPHLRDKVTEVRLRYVPSSTADRGFSPPATEPISTPGNGFDRGTGQPPRFQPQGTGGNSASGLLPRNEPATRNPSTVTPPQGTIPQFNPRGQSASSQNDPGFNSRGFNNDRPVPGTNGGNNSGFVPVNPATTNNGSGSQWQQPYGPPPPQSWQPPAGQSAQPATVPEFQPTRTGQPNNGSFVPRTPDHYRSSAPPSGNEYDTRRGQPQWNNVTPPAQPAPEYARTNPQQQTGQPLYPNAPRDDRFASRQWQNTQQPASVPGAAPVGYHPWQQPSWQQVPGDSIVNGHDRPMIPNQARIASYPGYGNQLANTSDITANIPGGGQQQQEVGPNRNPNPELPAAQINRFNSFLYFLLLCSIGLNIYLAWISRGFYVRYRELADELRETFATTV
ncbi:MAG: hypothetical protein ACR2NP_01465 [Pirellulaceae bacterium]